MLVTYGELEDGDACVPALIEKLSELCASVWALGRGLSVEEGG
jgi:hypothetical protein